MVIGLFELLFRHNEQLPFDIVHDWRLQILACLLKQSLKVVELTVSFVHNWLLLDLFDSHLLGGCVQPANCHSDLPLGCQFLRIVLSEDYFELGWLGKVQEVL